MDAGQPKGFRHGANHDQVIEVRQLPHKALPGAEFDVGLIDNHQGLPLEVAQNGDDVLPAKSVAGRVVRIADKDQLDVVARAYRRHIEFEVIS